MPENEITQWITDMKENLKYVKCKVDCLVYLGGVSEFKTIQDEVDCLNKKINEIISNLDI